MLLRLIVFILAGILAGAILKYTDPIVNLFGKNDLAEKYLGVGGTYTMWKLIAVGIVVAGLFYLIPPAFLR